MEAEIIKEVSSYAIVVTGAWLMLRNILADKARMTQIIEKHIRRADLVDAAVIETLRGCPHYEGGNPGNPRLDKLVELLEKEIDEGA